jgi:intein/homing endonuclease
MSDFVKLKNHERIKLFKAIKRNTNLPWERIYPSLNISRTMFFNYLSGKYDIPQELFEKLRNLARIINLNPKKIQKTKGLKKEPLKIKMNDPMAEILGVLNGDGHISNSNYEICVVGSILEQDYFDYLKILFENQLGLKFSIQPQHTKLKLRAYSKRLTNILNEKFGLPKGSKLGKLKIPKQTLTRKKWLRSYLRGLFDTDGSIYLRRERDLVINFSSADSNFLSQANEALKTLDFYPSIHKNNLYIYRNNEVKRFIKTIKPANSKHLKRYEKFIT